MYAPPGVDSDSSGEETTPPPTPPPPKQPRPHFSFRSLFSPTKKLDPPPSLIPVPINGKATEQTEKPVKEDTKKEETKPTKKSVRIFAGELLGQKGNWMDGLTTTRGDRVEPEPPSPPVEDASFGAPHPDMSDVEQGHSEPAQAKGAANEVLKLLRQLVADTYTEDSHIPGDSGFDATGQPATTPSAPFWAPPTPTFQAYPPHICYGPGPWLATAPPGWEGIQKTYPWFVGGQPMSGQTGTAPQVGPGIASPTPPASSSPSGGAPKETREKKISGAGGGDESSKKTERQSAKDGLGERNIPPTESFQPAQSSTQNPTTSGKSKSSSDYSTLKKSLDRYKAMYQDAIKRYEAGGEFAEIMKELKTEVKKLEIKIKEIKAKMEEYERAATFESTMASQVEDSNTGNAVDNSASDGAKQIKATPPDPPARSDLEASVARYKGEYAKVLKKYKQGEAGDSEKSQLKDSLKLLESMIKKASDALERSKKIGDDGASQKGSDKGGSSNVEPLASATPIEASPSDPPSLTVKPRQENTSPASQSIETPKKTSSTPSPDLLPSPRLEADIKKYKLEYSKALRAYKDEGLADEEKNEIKLRKNKLEEMMKKMSGAVSEAKKTPDGSTSPERPREGSKDHRGTSDSESKETITSSGSAREPAPVESTSQKPHKTDEPSSKPPASSVSRSKLASDVSRYKTEYQAALDLYKKGDFGHEEEKKRLKEQVKYLEAKYKKVSAMLDQGNRELEATGDVVAKSSEEQSAVPQKPAPNSLEASPAASPSTSKGKTPASSEPSDSSSTSNSSMQFESDIKRYKVEYGKVLKSYREVDASEDEKKRLKHELRRLEGKFKEATDLLGKAKGTDHKDTAPDVVEAKKDRNSEPRAEAITHPSAPSPQVTNKPGPSDSLTPNPTTSIEELKAKSARYEAQYRQVAKACKEGSLPEEEKSRLQDEKRKLKMKLKDVGGKLEAQRATESREAKPKEKVDHDKCIDKAGEKVEEVIEEEVEEVADEKVIDEVLVVEEKVQEQVKAGNTSKNESPSSSGHTQDTSPPTAKSATHPDATTQTLNKSSSFPNLQAYAKTYMVAYAQAVQAYKEDGLSDEEKRKRKEQVKRAEGKLKEATQAFEASTAEKTVQDPRERIKKVSEDIVPSSESSKVLSTAATHSSPAPKPTSSDAERYVVRYKAAYQQASNEYKQPGVSDDERKVRKGNVRRAEVKLKEAMQAMEYTPKNNGEGATGNHFSASPASPEPESATDWTTVLTQYKAKYARLTKSIKDDSTAHDRAEKINEADKLKAKIKALMAADDEVSVGEKEKITSTGKKADGEEGPSEEERLKIQKRFADSKQAPVKEEKEPEDTSKDKEHTPVPKPNLGNTILNTLRDTAPEGSSILSTLVSRIMTSLLMQQDIIESMRRVLGNENAEPMEEFVQHLNVVKDFFEGLYAGHGVGGETKQAREESERMMERGQQSLEMVSIQSIIEHLLGLTDFLTPGMIAVARRTFDAWRTEGFTMQSTVQAIMGVRKELRVIHALKAREREEEVSQKAKGLMSVLDMLLAFISPDTYQHDDERGREELVTVSDTREVHKSSKRLTYISGGSSETNLPTTASIKQFENHRSGSDVLHSPESSNSTATPSASRRVAQGPKSTTMTAEEHVHLETHSPLKLPQKTQEFLDDGGQELQATEAAKSAHVLIQEDDRNGRHMRLHREGSTDTDISPSRVITFAFSDQGSPKSSIDDIQPPEEDIWSAPSRYSQSSAASATTDGTVKSDRQAVRLLAQADSGPLPVRHDERDEVDDMPDKELEEVEPSADEVRRAEEVLYNKVLLPDTPTSPVGPAMRVA
ncbi:hypothetical protein IAR50_006714 [Cryptococcus sp. DSM 104548]